MPRFTVGARVRVAEEKTTGRIGTVVEVLSTARGSGNFDRYRVEFTEGDIRILSDMELSPAGSVTTLEEDVA